MTVPWTGGRIMSYLFAYCRSSSCTSYSAHIIDTSAQNVQMFQRKALKIRQYLARSWRINSPSSLVLLHILRSESVPEWNICAS